MRLSKSPFELLHRLICGLFGEIVWLYPTIARFDSDRDHLYWMRCKRCGFRELSSDAEIYRATQLESEETTP